MFSDPEIDTEGDSGPYDPAHGQEWFNFLMQMGLVDVEREEMGRGARIYTPGKNRYTVRVHSRSESSDSSTRGA